MAFEVALSTVLLVVGGLLMTSLLRVISIAAPFATESVITQDVSTGNSKSTDADRIRFMDQAFQALTAIPGVTAVGIRTSYRPWRRDVRPDAGRRNSTRSPSRFWFVNEA